MRFTIEVDVALSRPPKVDTQIWFVIESDSAVAAELTACQWAACHPRVVMPVGSLVIDWSESLTDHPTDTDLTS